MEHSIGRKRAGVEVNLGDVKLFIVFIRGATYMSIEFQRNLPKELEPYVQREGTKLYRIKEPIHAWLRIL